MQLTDTRVRELANVLVGLSLCHKQGTLYASSEEVARVTDEEVGFTSTVLSDAAELGWITYTTMGVPLCHEQGASSTPKSSPIVRWRLKDGIVVGVGANKHCDICYYVKGKPGVQAVADARTHNGSWGNVCAEDFVREGCGLGTGFGQFFRFEY